MSVPTVLAMSLLAAWMFASVCFTFRVPWIHDVLKRINWFRSFAHWTMFAAGPDPRIKPGAYVIEYRDGANAPWVTGVDGHHWRPYSFLLSPRRFIASRAHHMGLVFASMHRVEDAAPFKAELRDREVVIAAYLQRISPRPPGRTRTIRVMKRFGRDDVSEREASWQFEVRDDE